MPQVNDFSWIFYLMNFFILFNFFFLLIHWFMNQSNFNSFLYSFYSFSIMF